MNSLCDTTMTEASTNFSDYDFPSVNLGEDCDEIIILDDEAETDDESDPIDMSCNNPGCYNVHTGKYFLPKTKHRPHLVEFCSYKCKRQYAFSENVPKVCLTCGNDVTVENILSFECNGDFFCDQECMWDEVMRMSITPFGK